MGVALATKQTPFALLKPDNGAPVLVKVVDTSLPGGKQVSVFEYFKYQLLLQVSFVDKHENDLQRVNSFFVQMLVPATAEDLRDGGKIVVNNEESSSPEAKYEVR